MITATQATVEYPQSLIDLMNEMVEISNPCFVYGEYGRTELIRLQSPDVRVYDSREILEPKSLGGFYAVIHNELLYTQGILVDAMVRGNHICFKRIDANVKLLYYLRPVINDRTLVSSNGEEVVAHRDFRIFFTCKNVIEVRNVAFVGRIQFTLSDVLDTFGSYKRSVVEILDYIRSHGEQRCPRDKGLECDGICLKECHGCECHLNDFLCGRHFRMLCELRDTLGILSDEAKDASNSNRVVLYQSFVNIFLKHESKALSEMLYVSLAPLSLPNMLLAKTSPVEAALRSLILNIKKRKPTLLVGETGAGKTALVQYLCRNSEYFFGQRVDLKIMNMSSDFDGSDLIGGYRSIDFDSKIKDLYKRAKLEIPRSLDKRVLLKSLLDGCTGSVSDEARMLLSVLNKKVPFFYKEGILTDAMRNGSWILMDEINLCSAETLDLIEAILGKKEIVLYESGNFAPIRVNPNFMAFACMNPHGDFGKKRFDSNVFNKITFYDFGCKLSCIRSVVQAVTRNLVDETDQISEFYYEFKKAVASKEYTNVVEPLVSGRTLYRALSLLHDLKNDPDSIYHAFNLLFFTQLDLNSRARALMLFKKHFKRIPATSSNSGPREINGFIITPRVKVHLDDIELAIKTKLPVLLQGDTSTGKTSLVFALASKYGRKIVRINNHEHTESSDYLGCYLTTKDGIKFREGPLVSAMRSGSWVLLDELNLAPSDVLEVLNRLLDDNRELYVPELDETVRPHASFRIFATQNINYSGRQGLAKSFRNRFVEIFFYEKDEAEIREILEKSCRMPPSFARLMVGVYSALKVERTVNSLATLRDLFKWARRGPTSYYEVFEIGMDIILGRQRSEEDREKVIEVFTGMFKDRYAIEKKNFLDIYMSTEKQYRFMDDEFFFGSATKGLVLTRSYLRLIDLMYKAWCSHEPVLLIGETGIGKTRICEAVSSLFRTALRSINMHSGTESSDFIGHSILDKGEIVWRNGPLVNAMAHGNAFLIDEINLAEDSVLERMNSALESTRSLFIAETGKEIAAHDGFRVAATMNPGNDFGKRELSPALRSRFTEIYFELGQDEYEEIFSRMVDDMHIDPEYESFFKTRFSALSGMSIRKIELICNHIKNMYFGESGYEDGFVFRDQIGAKEQMWTEVLEILGLKVGETYKFVESQSIFGVPPYYVKKKDACVLEYAFETETTRVNLQRIIRGLTLGRGLLLEGEPGVGKTSIIQSIARACGIRVLRVNLSEQTEMSDLVGTYLPMGGSVKFVESEMVSYMRQGHWIILDEINLCTQSVIEGLNSILDHRRRIDVDNVTVHVHSNTRIFGTMNPYTSSNGRRRLPKSFLDRFVVISMDVYTCSDIDSILLRKYGKGFVADRTLSLRGNLKLNDLRTLSPQPRGKLRACSDFSVLNEDRVSYVFENGRGRIGKIEFDYSALPDGYVISHSQLPQIELLLKCLHKKIPVILCGSVGRSSLLKFISTALALEFVQINCHSDTDTFDLLGQYQKADFLDSANKDSLFVWQDSALVRSLHKSAIIAFNTPELVEKSVFDRLNALFEGEECLNIHEKGIDTLVRVGGDCRFVLCCDDPLSLSPALIDRCVTINLSTMYSYIDLYKIFHTTRSSGTKRWCCSRSDTLFRDFLGVSHQYISPNLDLDIKRHKAYSTIPSYLNKSLSVHNSLIESDIDQIFSTQLVECSEFDKELLSIYKHIESFSTQLPSTLSEKVNCLSAKPNLATFIKCLDFEHPEVSMSYMNCREVPDSLFAYKYRFVETLRSRTLGAIQDVLYFSENIGRIHAIDDVSFDSGAFNKLISSEDPLRLIRTEMANEKICRENEISRKISETAKSMYKYGIGSLEELIEEHDKVHEYYSRILSQIDRRLKRDYAKFRSVIQTLTFCNYLNNPDIRALLEEFNDLSDYLLVHLFKNRNGCTRCGVLGQSNPSSTKQLAIGLIKSGRYERCTKHEYSKYLFNSLMHIPQHHYDLVLEAICFNEPLDSQSGTDGDEFTEHDIDECIKHIFHDKTLAHVIDHRSTCISLGRDAISLMKFGASVSSPDSNKKLISILDPVKEMSIFSTPEGIINRIQEIRTQSESTSPFIIDHATVQVEIEKLEKLDFFLRGLYKTESCLDICRNYAFFQYFLFGAMDPESLERFLLGGSVHEFLDKLYFAECYLKINYSDCFYNTVLRYKAFEVESAHKKKLKEARLMLKREPKLYESTISLYVDRFMHIPVVSVLKIAFDPPACQGIHEMRGPTSLFALIPSHLKQDSESKEGKLCECQIWTELARNIERDIVSSMFSEDLCKDFVLHKFYNRTPTEPFGYSELCLAKTLNNIMNNSNSERYDECTLVACMNLLCIGCEYVFPPYLYFVYKFSDSFEQSDHLEEGVGLKSGEGRNAINDDVKEEDIVDDYDGNENNAMDSEGIDMDNQGELHSVSGEDEGESGADPSDGESEGAGDGAEDTEVLCEEGSPPEPIDGENGHDEASADSHCEESRQEDIDEETQSASEENEEEHDWSLSSQEEAASDTKDLSQYVYEWKEAAPNHNQTCPDADSYSKKVEGGNLEEKDALKEGEGDECAEGEGEIGREGLASVRSISFSTQPSDCTRLTSLLRIILESNRNNKYKGDFKSGKKLNLKKIVPYIASDYRKDRIWMRRQRSDKKDYVLRIFIDNSRSMFDQSLIDTLSAVYYKISAAFSLLNIPVRLYKFGSKLTECKIEDLTFDENSTLINWTDEFTDGINIILTDGVFQSVGYAKDNFLVVMIDKGDIKKMSKVTVLESKVFIEKYLDTFTLRYCILQNIGDLEKVFVEALADVMKNFLE